VKPSDLQTQVFYRPKELTNRDALWKRSRLTNEMSLPRIDAEQIDMVMILSLFHVRPPPLKNSRTAPRTNAVRHPTMVRLPERAGASLSTKPRPLNSL
jgi:hypothetical protein